MEDKQIFNNLKGLRTIKPENAWKQGLKAQLFDIEDSQKTAFSRGFLPFNLLKELNFVPALIPITLVSLVLIGAFLLLNIGQGPGKTAEQVNYFVLLETKLDQVNTIEDMQGIVSMIGQASDSISDTSDTAKNPKEIAEQAIRITQKVQEKIDEMKDSGAETKELEDANQVFASKAAEFFIKPDIENAQKELASSLINLYESNTLNDSQIELLNQAKEYYNNEQFDLALETILIIGE